MDGDGHLNFADYSEDSRNVLLRIRRNSDAEGELTVFKNYALNSSNSISLTNTKIKSSSSNTALSFKSANGKYNFRKKDDTTGYVINAEASTAGFILPEDAALASNYDTEGEYIGPVQDRVADLQAVVATLQQEKDTLLATVNDLVARITALEGA